MAYNKKWKNRSNTSKPLAKNNPSRYYYNGKLYNENTKWGDFLLDNPEIEEEMCCCDDEFEFICERTDDKSISEAIERYFFKKYIGGEREYDPEEILDDVLNALQYIMGIVERLEDTDKEEKTKQCSNKKYYGDNKAPKETLNGVDMSSVSYAVRKRIEDYEEFKQSVEVQLKTLTKAVADISSKLNRTQVHKGK